MTRTTHAHTRFQALGLLMAACLSHSAEAQTPRFRLRPIVKLGFTPNALIDGTIGINNQAHVVYGYIPPGGSVVTAWLRLHVGDYGQSRGFHKLSDLTATDAPNPCIAREINEAGRIAGVSDGLSASTGDATAWNAVSPATFTTPGLSQGSEAFSVNDDSPAKLTGRRGTNDQCQNGITVTLAFRWELTGGSGTLTNLSPVSPYAHCVGFDMGLDDTVSGISLPCGASEACAEGFRGTGWETSAITLPLGSIGSGTRTNFGYGTDDTGRIVGWTFYLPDQTIDCLADATFWENPGHTSPTNLGATMPSGQSGDESRAYAINNLTNAQVVGKNQTENLGVLWERNGSGGWSAIDLNTEIPCCRQNLVIREAHDINDNGWIVAWAIYDPPSGPDEFWAVLLSPYTCPEDIDFDGDVDVNDLNLVYFSNGGCPGPGSPSGDVDNDCDVDNDDFAQIIASYGDCEGGDSLGSSSPEIALLWLSAGGEESLDSEAITIEDVAGSLDEPTVGERIASLFSLIAD